MNEIAKLSFKYHKTPTLSTLMLTVLKFVLNLRHFQLLKVKTYLYSMLPMATVLRGYISLAFSGVRQKMNKGKIYCKSFCFTFDI